MVRPCTTFIRLDPTDSVPFGRWRCAAQRSAVVHLRSWPASPARGFPSGETCSSHSSHRTADGWRHRSRMGPPRTYGCGRHRGNRCERSRISVIDRSRLRAACHGRGTAATCTPPSPKPRAMSCCGMGSSHEPTWQPGTRGAGWMSSTARTDKKFGVKRSEA